MTRAYILLVVIGVCIVGFAFTRNGSIENTDKSSAMVRPDKAEWEKKMHRNPQVAYGEFTSTYADAPFGTQHEAAHIIGSMLYDTIGLEGISVCDASFAFGCYHGFFGRVISDKGVDIIPVLADSCRARYGNLGTGCEHGIGHGIMEYTGRDNLLLALELCKKTSQKDPLFGCTSGLFMEYNSAIVFSEDNVYSEKRVMDGANPLAPCNTIVPPPYRTSCYFEIALWWKDVFGPENEKIGNLCSKADTPSQRDACYQGWGTVVAESVDYSPDTANGVCELIHDVHGAAVCKLGVASRFAPAGYVSAAKSMCVTLTGSIQEKCEQLTRQSSL